MNDKLLERLDKLLKQGTYLRDVIDYLDSIAPKARIVRDYIPDQGLDQDAVRRHSLQKEIDTYAGRWMNSCISLLSKSVPATSHYSRTSINLSGQTPASSAVSDSAILATQDLLESMRNEFRGGLLQESGYILAAESFGDSTEHSEYFADKKRLREAAVQANPV